MKKFYLLMAMLGAMTVEAAPLTYSWSVNTSTFSGQTGQLSFQYNTSGTDATTATISQFSGATLGSFSVIGNVTGNLGSTVVFSPTDTVALNEVLQDVTFGNSFQFVLTLAGALIDNPQDFNGSQFALQILPGQGIPILAVTVEVIPGFEPIVTLDRSVSNVTAVPEPGTALLVLLALPAGMMFKRHRARQFSRR